MDFTCIFFGILFTLAGFWLAFGKVIALNGIIFLMKGFLPGFSNHWFVFAIIAWLIVAGFDVWYIEKSVRYRNQ